MGYDSEKVILVGGIGGVATAFPCSVAIVLGIVCGHWHLALLGGYIIGNFVGCAIASVIMIAKCGK